MWGWGWGWRMGRVMLTALEGGGGCRVQTRLEMGRKEKVSDRAQQRLTGVLSVQVRCAPGTRYRLSLVGADAQPAGDGEGAVLGDAFRPGHWLCGSQNLRVLVEFPAASGSGDDALALLILEGR